MVMSQVLRISHKPQLVKNLIHGGAEICPPAIEPYCRVGLTFPSSPCTSILFFFSSYFYLKQLTAFFKKLNFFFFCLR